MADNIKVDNFNEILNFASKIYSEFFKRQPSVCGWAPGRVNLIGEHTDYNDGFVLPMALPLITVVVGEKNESNKCRIITTSKHVDDPKEVNFELPSGNDVLCPGKPAWANYVKGVMANFPANKLCGFNAVIASSIPVGGGLSSSAAVEVAMYTFLEVLLDVSSNLSIPEKAKACQKAEHDFSGMPCGIMDQFISFMGRKDHALLLDCRSLDFTLVPMDNLDISILITNTNVRHQLTGSEYPTRKKQCEEASKAIGKPSLRDVSIKELEDHKNELSEVVYCRARHVVTEIERTLTAAMALEKGDYEKFGYLMQQSHQSLMTDYEVSCPELNQVVDAALEVEGVYGSRMTGGGFGGCTVTLLKADAVSKVIKNIKEKYKGKPTFYVCRPADGAHKIKLS